MPIPDGQARKKNSITLEKPRDIIYFMISQKYRFHGHASLKYVFTNGNSVRSNFFTVKYVENPHRRYPRMAVVVSKKIYKSAVKRNKIRRRIYEIARPFLKSAPAIDFVISVYSPETLSASHEELTIQLLPMFDQVGLKQKNIYEG